METNDDKKATHSVDLPRLVRKFFDLPLGTRFNYPGSKTVWVSLERHGCGKIAKWTDVDQRHVMQGICSAADTEEECRTIEVELVDLPNVLATPYLSEQEKVSDRDEADKMLRLFKANGNVAAALFGWLPIATAPKDRVILVNDTTGQSPQSPWAAARWLSDPTWSGWVFCDEAAADSNPTGPEPTLWFPVPELPKTTEHAND